MVVMDRNLQDLFPQLEACKELERSWKKHVEDERREYAEAKERCTIEEENIENLEAELEVLRTDTKVAFGQVNNVLVIQVVKQMQKQRQYSR